MLSLCGMRKHGRGRVPVGRLAQHAHEFRPHREQALAERLVIRHLAQHGHRLAVRAVGEKHHELLVELDFCGVQEPHAAR